MSSVKPKRRKIPYIGKPATASEIRAAYPRLTPEDEAFVDRVFAEMRARRARRRTVKSTTSAKTARAK
jgi:hypothetical protein